MIELQIELLLLIPFGMFMIKAVQALTGDYGLLKFMIDPLQKRIEKHEIFIETYQDHLGIIGEIGEAKHNGMGKDEIESEIKKHKLKLGPLLFISSPLYRCPVCMSSVWGTVTWFWITNYIALSDWLWPLYCLSLCGAMYMYENRETGDVYIKNVLTDDLIEE